MYIQIHYNVWSVIHRHQRGSFCIVCLSRIFIGIWYIDLEASDLLSLLLYLDIYYNVVHISECKTSMSSIVILDHVQHSPEILSSTPMQFQSIIEGKHLIYCSVALIHNWKAKIVGCKTMPNSIFSSNFMTLNLFPVTIWEYSKFGRVMCTFRNLTLASVKYFIRITILCCHKLFFPNLSCHNLL